MHFKLIFIYRLRDSAESFTKMTQPETQTRVLLLEGLNETGQNILRSEGYELECHQKALSIETLKEKIQNVEIIGIRSKTKLTRDVLEHAKCLKAVGCFCIGTNQVDLEYCAQNGVTKLN